MIINPAQFSVIKQHQTLLRQYTINHFQSYFSSIDCLLDSMAQIMTKSVERCMLLNRVENVTCHHIFMLTDLLILPQISVSSSMDWASDSQQQVLRGSAFTIRCSIQPQYPGGSFQLTFTSSNTARNYTNQLAVNHSAHFLFLAAEPAHQGSYSCVYHVDVFSYNFSSESRLLSLTVLGKLKQKSCLHAASKETFS